MSKKEKQEKEKQEKEKLEEIQQEEVKKEEKKELSLEEKFAELNDKHLRLHAEFENFKRRTAKERIDFIKLLEKMF